MNFNRRDFLKLGGLAAGALCLDDFTAWALPQQSEPRQAPALLRYEGSA